MCQLASLRQALCSGSCTQRSVYFLPPRTPYLICTLCDLYFRLVIAVEQSRPAVPLMKHTHLAHLGCLACCTRHCSMGIIILALLCMLQRQN
jgi:hypothetical protein